jgi:DNA-binding transcriptional LysR family regulator
MLDWDDLRFFLAIARTGSLSEAARSLRVAQSTVGRRLASLEAALGDRLLNRTPDGYLPTLSGQEVRKQAERVEAEVLTLERQVTGRDMRLSGIVKVTCSETLASNLAAPCLATLHLRHPDIMIELIPNLRELSLSMREADISLRLKMPDQHDLVVRRIGTLAFGLYASKGYIDRLGSPDGRDGCSGHHLISQLEGIQDDAQTAWLAEFAPKARIALQTTSHTAAMRAALHGGGIATLARFCADQEKDLVCIKTVSETSILPPSDIWLVVHKDNRDTPRMRVVLDYLTKSVRTMSSILDPAEMDASSTRLTLVKSASEGR